MRDIHIVKKGDTLSKIAKLHAVSVAELKNINHIANINHLDIGQKIALKKEDVLGLQVLLLDKDRNPIAKAGARELDSHQPVERFNTPVLHMDSPSTIHLASPASSVLFAGQHLHWTTQADTHWTAGHTLASVSGNATSLYTHSGGIQAFAANGAVSIQAHTDDLELLADEEVVVTSSQAHIHINAAKKITLKAGQSSITLDGANITFACPGTFKVKAGKHAFRGAGSKVAGLMPLPDSRVSNTHAPHNEKFIVLDENKTPVPNFKYKVVIETGTVIYGVTNSKGETERISTGTKSVAMKLVRDERS